MVFSWEYYSKSFRNGTCCNIFWYHWYVNMLNRVLNRREQHWRKGKRRYTIFFPLVLSLMSKLGFVLALTSKIFSRWGSWGRWLLVSQTCWRWRKRPGLPEIPRHAKRARQFYRNKTQRCNRRPGSLDKKTLSLNSVTCSEEETNVAWDRMENWNMQLWKQFNFSRQKTHGFSNRLERKGQNCPWIHTTLWYLLLFKIASSQPLEIEIIQKSIVRVQNCPDITILNSLFDYCLFVFSLAIHDVCFLRWLLLVALFKDDLLADQI